MLWFVVTQTLFPIHTKTKKRIGSSKAELYIYALYMYHVQDRTEYIHIVILQKTPLHPASENILIHAQPGNFSAQHVLITSIHYN